MVLLELEDQIFQDEVFNEEVAIKGGNNLRFYDCKFNAGLRVHVDRDVSNLEFKRSIFSDFVVGYFLEEGVVDGLLVDNCRSNWLQIFYAQTSSNEFNRRTKRLVWRNNECYDSPHAMYLPLLADNPILENNVGVGAHGENTNTFQINHCINPVIRGNVAGNTVATGVGDGDGIIIDWWRKTEDLATIDALVEDNLVYGSKGKWSAGINNWKGSGSIIRKNRLVDNTNGIRFNQYSDYHAYGNDYLNNQLNAKFTNGATDEGYA